MIRAAASIVLAYALGSIPASVIVVRRLRGVDVRDQGSGNAGAANVARVAGWRAALLVLVLDVAKGWLAVRLAEVVSGGERVALVAGLAALAGHLWPIFAGFRGGKGVAVSAGAVLRLDPAALVGCAAAFALVAAATRRVAAGSIAAAIALPAYLGYEGLRGGAPAERLGFGVLVAIAILLAHRDNLRRMRAGTEPTVELRPPR